MRIAWPVTFHANLALYEMGSDRRVWGVTIRSTPTRVFWSQIPPQKTRLAAMVGDREVHSMLELYSFPPVEEERRFKDIVILKPCRIQNNQTRVPRACLAECRATATSRPFNRFLYEHVPVTVKK
jgi:hypothetical protein